MSSTANPRQVVAERRIVTVLFADIVDSTGAAASQDVEQVRAGLTLVFDRAREVIEAHGGTVEKFIGDAIMAVFGIPRGHDDDPERAVRAALALHKLADELLASVGFPVRLRIGINTGEVAAGGGDGRDFLVTGLPVNVAARLYPAAEPGGILVGPLTRQLTSAVVRYSGPREVAGKGTGPVQAWAVQGVLVDAPGDAPRGIPGLRAPIVGRDEELDRLRALAERVQQERRPHLVTVIGEPGVGKSRLLREFAESDRQRVVRVGRCLPYGEGIEYHAIRSMLAEELDLATDGGAGEPGERIERRLRDVLGAEAAPEIADRLAVLTGYVDAAVRFPGVNADDVATELRWAFRRFVETLARDRTVVLVFEDLHWASAALLDLVEDLAERAAARLLVCGLARPELLDQRAGWGAQGAHATTIRLRSLGRAEAEHLVLELLSLARLPDDLVAEIATRSGGNPLYLEEVVRGLISAGHLVRSDEGWVATATPEQLEVPDTLRGIIASRLDRLGAGTQLLLQRASVLGRYFSASGLEALAGGASVDADALREAVRADFLVRDDERPSPAGATYHFRHALIRDAAYGSIAKRERRMLHEHAAEWLERAQANAGNGLAELAAYHLEQAYHLADDLRDADREGIGRRAYRALVALAWRKGRTGAVASASFARASASFAGAERIAADLAIPLAERRDDVAWYAVTRHPAKHGDVDQEDLFRSLDQVRGLGPTTGLAMLLGFAAHHAGPGGPALAAEALEVARATGDPEAIGWALWFTRDVLEPRDHERNWSLLEETLAIARKHDVKELLAFALVSMAERLVHEGKFTQARVLHEQAYAHAKASGARMPVANAATFLALDHAAIHHPEPMVRYIDEAIAAARESGNRVALANVLWQSAWGEYQNGLLEESRVHAEESLSLIDPAAWPATALAAHRQLARTYAALGEIGRARESINAMRPLALAGTRSATLLLSSGYVAMAADELDEAERLFREGLKQVERPDAEHLFGYVRWDWMRAMTQETLGELLLVQGRMAEAREMLSAALAFWSDPLGAVRRAEIEAKIART